MPVEDGELRRLLAAAESAWAQRDDPQALARARRAWEQALTRTPAATSQEAEILLRLARAEYLEAEIHIPLADRPESEVAAAYGRAAAWARRAMVAGCPAFAACLTGGGNEETCAGSLTPEVAAAAMFFAGALARHSRASGVAAQWQHRGTFTAIAARVRELDEGLLVAAPLRLLASVYARTPRWLGGDLALAEQLYQRALELYPHSVSTHLAFAEHWATRARRRDRFEELLRRAIGEDPAWNPETAYEERARQELARRLLARADELFTPTPTTAPTP